MTIKYRKKYWLVYLNSEIYVTHRQHKVIQTECQLLRSPGHI